MEHIIWNKEAECMDRGELKELQLRRLQETVRTCYEKVPLYKDNSMPSA